MSRTKKIIIISLLGFLVLSLGALIYYFFFYRTPERMVKNMQEKMAEIKTVHYAGENDIKFELEGSDMDVSINIEGDSDWNDKNNPKNSIKLDIGGTFILFNIDTQIELRSLSNSLYFRVNKVPSILSIYSDSLDFTEKWAKAEIEEQKKGDDFTELIKDPDLFKENIEVLKPEKVEGVSTYHYKVLINNDTLMKFINDNLVADVLSSNEVVNIKESIKSLGDLPFEVWIGKRDNYLYKIEGSIPFKLEGEDVTINTSCVVTNFNQAVKIEEPDSFKSIEELFGTFIGDLQKLQTQFIQE